MLSIPLPSRSTFFPYTTLFRSLDRCEVGHVGAHRERLAAARPDRADHVRHARLVEVGDHHARAFARQSRSEEHTSELQSLTNLVCRLLLEKKIKILKL